MLAVLRSGPRTESERIGGPGLRCHLCQANYGSFAKVQRGTICLFFSIQLIIFGYVPAEALRKEVELKAFVLVKTKPHIAKPPETT